MASRDPATGVLPGEAADDSQSSGEFPITTRGRGHEILDALATAVVVVDDRGRIEFANQRALRVLACSATTLLGADVGRVLAPFELIRKAAEAAEGDEARQTVKLPDAAEVVIGFHVRKLPAELDSDGESYTVVFQDITQWERMRDERDRLMRLAAVSEVLPSVLHELKNPLAAIGTAVELLVEDCTDLDLQERLHAVLPEIRRMTLTLEGIGSVGRDLSSGRYGAVDHALRESFRVLERQALERGIGFECAVKDMPLLPFDVAMVRAIVFNLLTNAIHACRRGDRIRLSAELTQDSPSLLRVSVDDSGTGMSKEEVERCRELFFTTKPRGTGIGLALCDRAAQAAGGRLQVSSQRGQGTTVTLEVPVRAPVRHSPGSAAGTT